MQVLDTDHLTAFDRGTSAGQALLARLERSGEPVATTIISVEEQLRGWLAQLGRSRDPLKQIEPYRRLQGRLQSIVHLDLLPFDERAAHRLIGLRVGTMDLKIAGMVLVQGGLLLTRNLGEFVGVPGLAAEDWLAA